ncbi:hypothetical protein JTB14_018343 [Gonioctena quinquepunctata]|nr:hypothetical protein JTB14_018343 [Gonioctena quinquepunctata]
MILNISRILLDNINMGREERYQRFEEKDFGGDIHDFYAILRTLLNISKILLDKINVGREKKGIQEELRRRGTLFYATSRTLPNISRILLDKINV